MLRAALIAVCTLALIAQDAPHPQFEVASIKLITEPRGSNNTMLSLAHGRFEANYAALRQLAGVAYGIQRVRVVRGPAWMDTDLYRVIAKAENPETNPDELRQMLQALLTEHFKFAVHRDTRQGSTYRLIQAKNGSKLDEAKEPGPPRMSPAGPGTARFGGHPLVFQNMEIGGLVNLLANYLGSPVKDETGLVGQFNFTLECEWTPAAPRHNDVGSELPTDHGPSIFRALQEQAGLKLEPSKGLIDILVVDHAEKVSPN